MEESLRLANLKIALQSLDVCLECLLALGRDATDGAGALALERLYDFDVTSTCTLRLPAVAPVCSLM